MANSHKICLSFVFNHRFEKNIPILREIYGNRFSTLRFLSPFSQWGLAPDIIPIFETSVHFEGYFAQAYPHLPKDYDYYAFCADDLFLNPRLNERNLIEKLNCTGSAYIKYINPVWEHSFAWHKFEECMNFPNDDCVVPYTQFLPSREELLETYALHGFSYRNVGFQNFLGAYHRGLTIRRVWEGTKYFLKNGLKRFVHFPLVEGYSDFIIVPKEALERFCFLCGVFAAMNLWVDSAIATAMTLSSNSLRLEKQNEMKGREIWDEVALENLLNATDGKIKRLSEQMPENQLYVHPVKLSAWS